MLSKQAVHQCLLDKLAEDLRLFLSSAKKAHEAATDDENIPDNKYDTLSLEASYLAQGQANRAQEIRQDLHFFQNLQIQEFDSHSEIGVTALITLEDEEEVQKVVFLLPKIGGVTLNIDNTQITVITPESPLGRMLLGKAIGDVVEMQVGSKKEVCWEVIDLC